MLGQNRLLRICRKFLSHRKVSTKFLPTIPKYRLNYSLITWPKATFFWSKKNTQKKESPKYESIEEEIESMGSLRYLVDKIKEENRPLPPLLPPQDPKDANKLTVVMEIDEVLLYTFFPDEHEAYLSAPQRDLDIYMDFPEYDTFLSIYKRPHLDTFLKYIKENCEGVLFCAGVKGYVDKVMDAIDTEKAFKYRLYQDSCNKIVHEEENIDDFVKDLDRLGRDPSRYVYIDSKGFAFWMNPENGVPISEYIADSTIKDNDLLNLIELLEELKTEKDVRTILFNRFGIKKALEESKML